MNFCSQKESSHQNLKANQKIRKINLEGPQELHLLSQKKKRKRTIRKRKKSQACRHINSFSYLKFKEIILIFFNYERI